MIAINSIDNRITALWQPTKANSTFEWWFSDEGFANRVQVWNTAPTHLYAKWSSTYLCDWAFGNATMIEWSDENLTWPTTSQLYDSVAEAWDNKCAWVCNTWYHRVGQACIQNPYQCEWTFANATLVAWSDQNLTANTTSTLYATVVDAWNNKCAYACDDGYRLTNWICVAENQIVKNLELYFLESNGTINHTTLMDRNLWATEVYNQNYDSPNTASYGYYYQWWNNRWFDNQGSVTTSSEQVDASGYGPGNYYSSAVFIIGSQWDTSNNENLWWEVTNTFDARQWPCPSGYHVPSNTEWKWIYDDWNDANIVTSDIWRQWASDFLMPFVGYRSLSSSSVYSKGSFGQYWSSKAKSVSAAYSFTFDSLVLSPYNEGGIANGYSVRCFKNAANAQTLTIDANWWTKAVIAIDDGKITALWEPIREWHTFGWWYSDPGFSTTSSVHVWDTAPTHLYAKWTKNEYQCIWTFANATQVNWHAGVLLVDVASTLYDTILEANEHQCSYVCNSCYQKIWNSCSLKNYTITYDVDGWSPAISNDTVTCGGSTLLAIGPTKAGYTFTWWKSSVTNQVYSGGVRYTPTSNVTMTAQWIDCMNYITYYANGWTLAYWTTNPTAVRCGNSTTLAAAPSRTCYTFTKWKNSANSQLYSAWINFSPNGNTTMSAQWNPVIYTLTYNCNGWNGNPWTQTWAYGDIWVLKNGGCEKANNTLVWWSLTQNGSSYVWWLWAQMSGDLMNTCTNKILYAIYQENPKCTITFNSNGWSTVAPQTIYCGSLWIKPANPTKNWATFAWWYSNSSLTSPYNWGSEVNNNITLHAKWNNCTRTINYVLNGWLMPAWEPNPATVQCGGSKILPEPSKACYTFRNWVGSGTNTYNAGTSFTPNSGNVTLKAQWNLESFTLKYNCGNWEGNPWNATMKYWVAWRTKSTGCSKTWYQLIWWSLTQNSSTATWWLWAKITLYSCNNPTTLYAVYAVDNRCIITFESNGWSTVPSQVITCGTKWTEPANPTFEWHTFGGWYDESSLSNLHDWTGVVNGNITLYAKWTTRQYTATIRATPTWYGTLNGSSQVTVTKYYDTPITIDGNKVIIWEGSDKVEVTATPKSPSGGYIYRFDDWTNNCGETLTSNCTITANFSEHVSSATFTEWYNFNRIIKTLADWPDTPVYGSEFNNYSITSVVKASSMPDGVEAEIVSSEDSILPIYAWYNDGTIYYYTEANTIYLNENSSDMFDRLLEVTTIDMRWRNTKKVTDMHDMFDWCMKLTELDLSWWDTSSVTNMYRMFHNCQGLTSLDLSSFNTKKVTNMSWMFHDCQNLGTITFGTNWNTEKVTDMSYMFYWCKSLNSLNVSNWNVSSVTNMSSMFENCVNLNGLDVSNWNTEKVTNMRSMFESCSSLAGLNVSNWDTSQVTNMNSMFESCSSLAGLNVSNWNTEKVTDMFGMFFACYNLKEIKFGVNWNTEKVTDMRFMFSHCYNLEKLINSNGNVNVLNWNTSSVSEMNNMFFACHKLPNLDLSSWDTSNVTNMNGMFELCHNLAHINFGSNWNTKNVTDMWFMFDGCDNLESLDVSTNGDRWNTENVTNMVEMFHNCEKLAELDVSNWKTNNVTDMALMFWSCRELEELDVSGWSTSQVTDMGSMFYNCEKIEELDLSNWNIGNVTHMSNMFWICTNLRTIYASSDFDTSIDSEHMFGNNYALKWWNGTEYNHTNPTDNTYAKIDRPWTPWYFTAKP